MAGWNSRIHDDAAAWVARADGSAWTNSDEAELQQWLALDPLHGGALLQAQAAWTAIDLMHGPAGAQGATEDEEVDRSTKMFASMSRRSLIVGSGAATAALIAGGIAWYHQPIRLVTELGEIRRVPLADGSVVTINTQTKIEVTLAASQREVSLDSGEAWFEVAKDKARPFTVAAGRVRARAVGTAFAVRRYGRGASVLVTEGVVDVWAAGAQGHRVRVAAGERVFVTEDAAVVRAPTRPAAGDRALAWRSGKMDLAGDRLDHAIDEFNRYNRRKLVLLDDRLAGEQLDGVFRIDDPDGFALAIRGALDIPVDLSRADEIQVGRRRSP